ncbi:MAG TPA: ROK family protein, partial [Methylomirabilota bacterium]|nr:ROK family protein [Methylomirabilota bacterium]
MSGFLLCGAGDLFTPASLYTLALPMKNNGLTLVEPKITPELDPAFRPAALTNQAFCAKVETAAEKTPLELGLEQSDGSIFHYKTAILPTDHPEAEANFVFVERLIKFLLWSRGGFRIHFNGPLALSKELQHHYRKNPTGIFDAQIMGERIYERPFDIKWVAELPPEHASSAPLGRHLNGCRIGFDLGGSDRKVAAVIDGNCVFSEEVVWDPVPQRDPQYHFDGIMDSLKRAAAHLPRVDAIGGSAAGVYVNNEVKVASLFRGVAPEIFASRVKCIFSELRRAW